MLQQPFYLLFLFSILTFPAATSAAPPLTSLPADAISLLAFKSQADLDNKLLYTTNERFDYCQWKGVKCSQGRVVRYVVQSSGLRGTVAAATLSSLDHLKVLSIRNNSLSGTLPDFSSLINLKTLILDHNHFAGTFPPSILSLHSLLILDISHNNFTGVLPDTLTVLDRLRYLRLDSNLFYGTIPPLNQSMLEVFNVSFNNLTGPVPVTPTLKKFKVSSFLDNTNLCGEMVNKPCRFLPFFNSAAASPPAPLLENEQSQQGLSDISGEKHHRIVGLVLGVVVGSLILAAAILSVVALSRKRREDREHIESNEAAQFVDEATKCKAENATCESEEGKKVVRYQEQNRVIKNGGLVFCSGEEGMYSLEQLMTASAELLGRGSLGTTYKAVMAGQLIVSVKRLDASKTGSISGEAFEEHMEGVGVLRHPNLVPVRAYFQAKQERLIILDYQPNGSLFSLIHGSRSARSKPLHWTSCLKIAEDIAQGLAYIHQASKFIHGNLKPSNVLLGPDFEACITDYCLTILADSSSIEDPDSAGYRAPEARKSCHRVNSKVDVYSFGVLLLELLTGKPPPQHPFLAPPDMADWVQAMRDDDSEEDTCVRMLVEVAGICSLTSPEQRPTMWQVLKMIASIKDASSNEVLTGN